MNGDLTIVLPLRIDSAGTRQTDLDRFALLLWPSFLALWREPQKLRWLLVCPAEDAPAIRRRLASLADSGKIEIVVEDDVVPTLADKRGWHKQQLLKLAAAQLVTTPYYLTLDADLMLLRATGVDDLFPDGGPLLGDRRGCDHSDWWQGSAKMLRSAITIRADDLVMGVTPALLQTGLARRVIDEVARRQEVEDGARFLFESRREQWTEYTLYWLLALETGVAEAYRRDARPLYKGIFEDGDATRLRKEWLQQEFGRPDGPRFCVVQSKRGHAIADVGRAVRGIVDLPQARAHDRSFMAKIKGVWQA